MNVKRYVAPTAREALRRVKAELGPDAIVVSNKPVAEGVEIMAMSADGLAALAHNPASNSAAASGTGTKAPAPRSFASGLGQPRPMAPSDDEDYTVTLSTRVARPQVPSQPTVRPWQPPRHEPQAVADVEAPRLRPLPPRDPVPTQAEVAASLRSALQESEHRLTEDNSTAQVSQLMQEMRTIKTLLEQQLAGFALGEMARQEPTRALLLSEILDAGFSSQLSRRLIEEMPSGISVEEGRKWLKSSVNRRLRTVSTESDLIDRGGVYALVGPTGVGKTTTTAKLAARCVVRHGADRLALLTTDGYRIGAHEQLRIYGRILGVPVYVVRDGDDLRNTLADLRDKHMVLIDTMGMSQRDRMVAEQAAMLMRVGEVQRLLLLNATSRGDTLDDVVRAYAGEDLAGCLLTKVDEAASIAPALDAVIRHGLLLAYVANGQRVPEDLHLPNRNYLLHRCFKQPADASPHRLRENDAGLIAGRGAGIGATLGAGSGVKAAVG
ncbi:MAG: flagellar biosynthesis protein FlhF [Rhodocyclaceae bacterium]|nr:flagellar biosynthesis protein FlhF [Rhodocyclaceae bacterium]